MASAGGADDDDGLVGGAVVATACSNHVGYGSAIHRLRVVRAIPSWVHMAWRVAPASRAAMITPISWSWAVAAWNWADRHIFPAVATVVSPRTYMAAPVEASAPPRVSGSSVA